VADALFPSEPAIGKEIRARGQSYQVIGVAARQGTFLGIFSWDAMAVFPLTSFKRYFANNEGGQVRVQVDAKRMGEARDELRGLMRRIRQLNPEQPDDFELNEQAAVRAQLDPLRNGIALAGLFITGLALFV